MARPGHENPLGVVKLVHSEKNWGATEQRGKLQRRRAGTQAEVQTHEKPSSLSATKIVGYRQKYRVSVAIGIQKNGNHLPAAFKKRKKGLVSIVSW